MFGTEVIEKNETRSMPSTFFPSSAFETKRREQTSQNYAVRTFANLLVVHNVDATLVRYMLKGENDIRQTI
jgi:hypothetical protein